MSPLLELRGLVLAYGNITVVKGIDLKVEDLRIGWDS